MKILKEVQSIKRLADEQKGDGRGSLAIGTTHTQARYVLPQVIRKFRERYPDVELHLHQGTSEQIADMAARDRIDFAINTGSQELFSNLVLLPCYRWHRRIVVPQGHPLANEAKITIETLGEISDRHLRVRFLRPLLAAADLRARRRHAARRAHRA